MDLSDLFENWENMSTKETFRRLIHLTKKDKSPEEKRKLLEELLNTTDAEKAKDAVDEMISGLNCPFITIHVTDEIRGFYRRVLELLIEDAKNTTAAQESARNTTGETSSSPNQNHGK